MSERKKRKKKQIKMTFLKQHNRSSIYNGYGYMQAGWSHNHFSQAFL